MHHPPRSESVPTPPRPGEAEPELASLQRRIHRERVDRARSMSAEERLTEAFRLTDEVFARMHAGAMAALSTNDAAAAWSEVARRLERLRAVHRAGRTVFSRPDDATGDP